MYHGSSRCRQNSKYSDRTPFYGCVSSFFEVPENTVVTCTHCRDLTTKDPDEKYTLLIKGKRIR